jgi:hypothetical protein
MAVEKPLAFGQKIIRKFLTPLLIEKYIPQTEFQTRPGAKKSARHIVAIGSRIPMNLLDRLISSFAGYALALLAWGVKKKIKKAKVIQNSCR